MDITNKMAIILNINKDLSIKKISKDYELISKDGQYSEAERKEILLGMKNVDDVVTYKREEQFHDYLKSGDYHIRFLGTDYMTKKYTGSDIPITIVWLDRENHAYSTTRLKKQIYQSVNDMMKITLEFD